MPKFTVVIPVHNREKYIERAVKSVLAQSFQDFEIAVVDDHSTDNTAEVVERLIRNHPQIHFYRQIEARGAQAARNRGIKEANGEWIAFLDSDDTWMSEHLTEAAALLHLFDWNPDMVVYTDCVYDWVQDSRKKMIRAADVHTYSDLLRVYAPMFQGMIASKHALNRGGLLDEAVPSNQEWDAARLLARECRFIHLCRPHFTYFLHGDETISKDKKRDVAGLIYLYDKYQDDIMQEWGKQGLLQAQRLILSRCLQYEMKEEFESLYQRFENRHFHQDIKELVDSLTKFLDAHVERYAYGAGRVARVLTRFLAMRGQNLDGFLVTDISQKEDEAIDKTRVTSIAHLAQAKDAAVVIATRENLHDAMLTNLVSFQRVRAYLILDRMFFLMDADVKLNSFLGVDC